MAIRSVQVRPSQTIEIDGTEFPMVTAEDIIQTFSRVAVVLEVSGGHATVTTRRVPTGFPNEYVIVEAAVSWLDRTNARPQPEPDAREEAPLPSDPGPTAPLPPEPPSQNGTAPAEGVDTVGDGLVVDPDGEDVSEVPAELL